MTHDDCVFCQRIKDGDYTDAGGGIVHFPPLNPVTTGHLLFVARRHARTAASEPWLTGLVFQQAAYYAAWNARQFNLITSAGPAATQTIRHLHVHYIPRQLGDGLLLPWSTP